MWVLLPILERQIYITTKNTKTKNFYGTLDLVLGPRSNGKHQISNQKKLFQESVA